MVPLQILVAAATWPGPVKYPMINGVAFPLLFLSYHYLVRNTLLGKQLNGRKFPRAALVSAVPRLWAGRKRLGAFQGAVSPQSPRLQKIWERPEP